MITVVENGSKRVKWPDNLLITIFEIPRTKSISFREDIIYIGELLMSCRELTSKEYVILEMTYRHRKKSIDIADIMNIEDRSVRNLQTSAISKLKKSEEKKLIIKTELELREAEKRKKRSDELKRQVLESIREK